MQLHPFASRRAARPSELAQALRAAALGLCLGPISFVASAQADTVDQAGRQRHFEIAPGPLGAALAEFASQAGITLPLQPQRVQGLKSRGLSGDADVDTGLSRLLEGTGLRASRQGDGLYVLRPVAEAEQPLKMDSSEIMGARQDGLTEGTGSYTTGAMQTATKLNLSLRETPQSVTVMTRQRLDDQALADLNDVVQNTPGMVIRRTGPERSTYYARGFALDNIMYDGLPTSLDSSQLSQDLLSADMAMYDRVEVVRGATGLMQGAGNPAAAINLVRKRPTPTFQASIQGSAGTWDRYRTDVDLSGPLTDNGAVRGRLVTAYQTQGSFRDSLDNERNLFYGIVEADLNDSTTLTLSASRQQDDYNGNGWTGLPVGFDGSDLKLSRSTSLSNDWEYWNKTSTSAYAAIEHALDNGWKLNLSATKSWADLDMLGTYILGRTATQTYDQYVGAGHYRESQNSFDAYASGPFRLMDRDHELVFGASHRRVVFNGDVPVNVLLHSNIDIYNWNGDTPKIASQTKYGWQNTNAKLNSVYATTRLNLADPLKLILGSRLDWYENDTSAPYKGTETELKVNRHVTKYAGLIYDLDAHHSVYVSYTDIFKPQSYFDTSGSVIAPITGKNYELGIKGEYFDGALNASAAIFQLDQENRAKAITDQSLCPSYPTTSCYEAAGEVRSKGIELELQGQLTPNWQLGAGYTFTEAKYRKDANKSNEGRLFDTDIPRHLFKMSTTYTLPGALDQWRIGSSLYRQNRIYNKGTTYMIEQDAYTLVDFMLGFKPTAHIDAQLNLNNAFDKKYYNSLSSSVTVPSNVYGEPRNMMLSVKYSF
ncbi:TonB-dependent siderophore receptor [Pseudomonas citronellolis]|uniref:TonB-dependent siderophore receptor n=1 Tax=Pseudomonas citronellolis TaxID=53408 RepID=A0AAW6P5J8_9PSED|nr:TonB-dependent receptor [Pseudomonas citronellolis]MDF3841797.1 TonB-dependent siderophore receptor [Pseudomonas citronellolis]